MKKITTTARPVYVEYEPEYMPVQRPYEVVMVKRPRRPLAPRAANAVFVCFVLGLVVFVLLCFVVDDIDWLIKRSAAALVIILIGGGGLTMALSFYEELRGLFMALLGVDDED